MTDKQEQPFDPGAYPLVDAETLARLDKLGARDPRQLIYTLQDTLSTNAMRAARAEISQETLCQMVQAAGHLMRLHQEPVPKKPSQEVQHMMVKAAAAAGRRAARHPEYENRDDEPRQNSYIHRPGEPSHFNVMMGVQFEKNGISMMTNPHGTDMDYDYPEMTGEGQAFLKKALEESALEAGLELKDGVSIVLRGDEKGWVSIGYHWQSGQ